MRRGAELVAGEGRALSLVLAFQDRNANSSIPLEIGVDIIIYLDACAHGHFHEHGVAIAGERGRLVLSQELNSGLFRVIQDRF